MASFDEMAKGYSDRIRKSRDKKNEIYQIMREIDSLVYATSKKALSNEDKIKLLNKVKEGLEELKKEKVILEHTNNENHIALINHMIELLENNKDSK